MGVGSFCTKLLTRKINLLQFWYSFLKRKFGLLFWKLIMKFYVFKWDRNAIYVIISTLKTCKLNFFNFNCIVAMHSGGLKNGKIVQFHKYNKWIYFRALYEEQKEFVAHSFCQLLLNSRWMGGLKWCSMAWYSKFFHILMLLVLSPILCILYILRWASSLIK